MIEKLYSEQLTFNCSYYEMKSENKSDLLIVFLGCSEFLITNNYWGVVAIGRRAFDFDTNTAKYKYTMTRQQVEASRLEKLIKTYEAKRLKLYSVEVVRVESLEG